MAVPGNILAITRSDRLRNINGEFCPSLFISSAAHSMSIFLYFSLFIRQHQSLAGYRKTLFPKIFNYSWKELLLALAMGSDKHASYQHVAGFCGSRRGNFKSMRPECQTSPSYLSPPASVTSINTLRLRQELWLNGCRPSDSSLSNCTPELLMLHANTGRRICLMLSPSYTTLKAICTAAHSILWNLSRQQW